MKIKVAQYIADFLFEHNIEHVFTVTGGGAMHLNDALGHHKKLKCIYNHHEQASAIAAEAYTRLTGKLPAVCVTSGPGGTNAITGVLGAWLDSIPMFVISGQVKRETTVKFADLPLRQLGDQEFDITHCVSGMTKYAVMVFEPNEIRYHLEKALYLCCNGRGGPVWLDIPLDIQGAVVETDELKGFDPTEMEQIENPVYDEPNTEIIIEKIKQAKRPVIFAGTGIRLAKAHPQFITLIEKLQIPVVTAWNAHDSLWDTHPCYCGRPGTVGTRGGNFIVENSDLLLVLGCRLNIRQISYNYKDFAKNAYKIVVDIDANELKKPTLDIQLPVHANVKDVIEALNRSLPKTTSDQYAQWLAWCKDINRKYPAVLPEYYPKKTPVNPYIFIKELFEQLEENETIVCGNGTACVVTFQAAELKKGQRLFTNSGSATMGYGLPAAMGADVATYGKRTICIDGDGSIQMNLQELQTLVHNKLNVKIFLLNNEGYHSMRQTQINLFQPPLVGVSKESGISFPDFNKLAYAYGITYEKIESSDTIDDKIKKTLALEGSAICEVMIDPEQFFAPKLSSKVLPDGKIVSPPMDDMFPFLDRDEYEQNKKIK